jgi:ASC-1-like (ASCH) protein
MVSTINKRWEAGRESHLLDDIIAGRKTIEGRLNRGKFSQYKVGDIVHLRRDWRDAHGVLHDGEPDAARVRVVAIRHYATFLEMIQAEDWQQVIPRAGSDEAAVEEYNKYYSADDQQRYGVLAIEIRLVSGK